MSLSWEFAKTRLPRGYNQSRGGQENKAGFENAGLGLTPILSIDCIVQSFKNKKNQIKFIYLICLLLQNIVWCFSVYFLRSF